MANDFSPYVPQFWALETIRSLENNTVLPQLIHRDFEPVLAELGDTVNTRKPGTFTTNDKTNYGDVTVQDATATNVAVTIDKHKEVTFLVSERDMKRSLKNLIDTQVVPAAIAIANQMDVDIYDAMVKGFYYTAGTAGSVPSTLSAIAAAKKKQTQKKVPLNGRQLVIGPTVEEKFVVLDAFINQNFVGEKDGTALETAKLGTKLGFALYQDQNVELGFVQANAINYVADGTQTVGGANLVVKTGTGAVAAGALITISGDEYVVLTGGSGAATWTVSPNIRSAYTDGTAITVIGANSTYYKLPFFRREACALVTRLLDNPADMGAGVKSFATAHNGVPIRVVMSYNATKMAWQITLDTQYGVKVLDGEQGGFLLS